MNLGFFISAEILRVLDLKMRQVAIYIRGWCLFSHTSFFFVPPFKLIHETRLLFSVKLVLFECSKLNSGQFFWNVKLVLFSVLHLRKFIPNVNAVGFLLFIKWNNNMRLFQMTHVAMYSIVTTMCWLTSLSDLYESMPPLGFWLLAMPTRINEWVRKVTGEMVACLAHGGGYFLHWPDLLSFIF